MADEENMTAGDAEANGGEARRTPVAFSGKRVPTSYANAFQTRVMDGMVTLTYGVSYSEPVRDQEALVVDMERRVVMTPEAAGRLLQALVRLLRPVAPATEAGSPQGAEGEGKEKDSQGEAETFGQN